MNVTSLDLEPHPLCQYDWLAMTTENYDSESELANMPESLRICRKTNQMKVEVNAADQAFIYFYTDRH
jgi:hypothetical protein